MDIISYNIGATANGRIEIINANPDSTSGIITVPKTIASGETVTIPAGRVAVLPNVQVDGTLNVEGDVFIPAGATFGDLEAQIALKAPLSSPTFTGNPTAPTPTAGDNSTKVATTAYVDGKMVLGTAVSTTSGTAFDFTGIPSWVKRITVMFNNVSTNGASQILIQLGDNGGVENTGYLSTVIVSGHNSTPAGNSSTSGIITDYIGSSSNIRNISLELLNIQGNIWLCSGTTAYSNILATTQFGGNKTLSSTLNRIRITTANGTDTFNAGSINIMYEG